MILPHCPAYAPRCRALQLPPARLTRRHSQRKHGEPRGRAGRARGRARAWGLMAAASCTLDSAACVTVSWQPARRPHPLSDARRC